MLRNFRIRTAAVLVTMLMLVATGAAQKKKIAEDKTPVGTPILWQQVNVANQDLFDGPGGTAMQPDLSNITFIEREKTGHNKKYRIKDGSGRIWVAKPGTEARPETVANRLLAGLG